MKIIKLNIPDILLIEPIIHSDDRGNFMESYRKDMLMEYNKNTDFVQDNLVNSSCGVLRGLHYQKNNPQDKLVQVAYGEIFDVAVDIRRKSNTFGNWVGEVLSKENRKQLYVPSGFAHGYCVLSDKATVLYKCTDYFYANDQYGIKWNDSTLKINWPINNPNISEKDSKLPTFEK